MSTLGPAQNPDGSFKDASQIQWSHSRSPSPVRLSPEVGKLKKAPTTKTAGKRRAAPYKKPKPLHPSRPNSGVPHPVKQRINLTLSDEIRILDFIESPKADGKSQTEIAAALEPEFPNIKQCTISRIIKKKKKIRERAQDSTQLTFKRPRKVTHPALESALSFWATEMQSHGIKLTGDLIRAQAKEFSKLLDIPESESLKFSGGWLDSFKARHLLKEHRFHGEAASVSAEAVAKARKRLQELTAKFEPRNIINMDETALFYRMPPNRGLASQQLSGQKGDKTRMSLAFWANADGSEKGKVLIIGHARKPHCFLKKEGSALGFWYFWNKKAWMVGSIFQAFLEYLNKEMKRQDRHVLVLVDNAPSHVFEAALYPNLTIEFLEPNMTSHIQPMDAGIIRAFKAHYRRLYIELVLQRYQMGESDIYCINQLEGMHLLQRAWDCVTKETVANCWRHAGILGSRSNVRSESRAGSELEVTHPREVTQAMEELSKAVEQLCIEGHLAANDVPSMDELVANVRENQTESSWTPEEIVEQVRRDEREARGETVDEPEANEISPLVTLSEAQRAAATLLNFCQFRDGENVELTRQLLQQLSREVSTELFQSKRQTTLSSFLAAKV